MTNDERDIQRKLRVLQHAEKSAMRFKDLTILAAFIVQLSFEERCDMTHSVNFKRSIPAGGGIVS